MSFSKTFLSFSFAYRPSVVDLKHIYSNLSSLPNFQISNYSATIAECQNILQKILKYNKLENVEIHLLLLVKLELYEMEPK